MTDVFSAGKSKRYHLVILIYRKKQLKFIEKYFNIVMYCNF